MLLSGMGLTSMNERPLRSLTVADFRCIEGLRQFPLDAPVVLIHGPNGTGKTSLLSALEMALTGRVSSMARQDETYTAHLPYKGQPFAMVQAGVEGSVRPEPTERMTIAGARVTGQPALDPEEARFYSERCYLDQSSLGRLLELYQLREGKQESLLARFVNELLGLEDLDSLRSGLQASTHLTQLKKVADRLAQADEEAKRISREEVDVSAQRDVARVELDNAATQTSHLLASAGIAAVNTDVNALLEGARRIEPADVPRVPHGLEVDRELAALRGRIEVVADRPTAQRRASSQTALEAASARFQGWKLHQRPLIDAWIADARAAGISTDGPLADGMAAALEGNAAALTRQDTLRLQRAQAVDYLTSHQSALDELEVELSEAQTEATSMVEGLAAVRSVVTDDICPVCDRDFGEVATGHLSDHLDSKITRLAEQGTKLVGLHDRRSQIDQQVDKARRELDAFDGRLLPPERVAELSERQSALEALSVRLDNLGPAMREGEEAEAHASAASRSLEALQVADTEHEYISTELARLADLLNTPIKESDTPTAACARLVAASAAAIEKLQREDTARRNVADASRRLGAAKESFDRATTRVAETVHRRTVWDGYVNEAKRRQKVAREVFDAASKARTTIVQSVFTDSLNHVWADLFTRLAPSEEFVPAFGVPSATKTALEVTLETHLPNGDPGGPPQMMLSAGNLNTAALSLFLALHLAVEPLVPCLVFDDPVQAMDEVHVAQFAALIRTLSKQEGRQVVIAVHERELFEYLALELSPAYQGDSLITIELGDRSADPDEGITHLHYAEDRAFTS
ncbi:AAA family ATPase [Nocardioides sp. WS12]|uniref:AAA family ATPase n=1 Tax=Nocardioides sp. WS12 TaxID=2486272 RepID=UPI0015FC99D3|nr:AAA family ATPase [Nocardioides sp. WS12]